MATRLSSWLNRKSYSAGFSYLELVVVICLIAILYVIALNRIKGLQAGAEKVAVERVVASIQSAIAIRVAKSIIKGKSRDLYRLQHSNPINLLVQRPANYVGEFKTGEAFTINQGHWYYDSQQKYLIYKVRHNEFFDTGLTGEPRARFQLQLVYVDNNKNGQYDLNTDALRGLSLESVDHFEWLIGTKAFKDIKSLVVQPQN